MNRRHAFFWPENTSLRTRRLALCAALLLASTAWFILGTLLAARPTNSLLLGWFWIDGSIIALTFVLLLKTRQDQRAEGSVHPC
jgi:hypothetical protein